MKPAEAMGTFLRTWRSEWAGMSRAQLGIAVSAQCGKRRSVTEPVVRHWEEGQAPKSTTELEALMKVMRRNGLSQPEVDDFRKAVLGSVCDRQYPELFEEESFAHRKDVDEVAHGMWQATLGYPCSGNLVRLVASVQELEAAVDAGSGWGASRTQAQQQQVALGYARVMLARHHTQAGRRLQGVLVTERTLGTSGHTSQRGAWETILCSLQRVSTS